MATETGNYAKEFYQKTHNARNATVIFKTVLFSQPITIHQSLSKPITFFLNLNYISVSNTVFSPLFLILENCNNLLKSY